MGKGLGERIWRSSPRGAATYNPDVCVCVERHRMGIKIGISKPPPQPLLGLHTMEDEKIPEGQKELRGFTSVIELGCSPAILSYLTALARGLSLRGLSLRGFRGSGAFRGWLGNVQTSRIHVTDGNLLFSERVFAIQNTLRD